jgi:2-polyprenyl-6-methoxyphenol hydroxylase-like FAD-dependent oxidoreductase
LKRLEMPVGVRRAPLVVALRPALHGALLAAVGLEHVVTDAEVTSFVQERDRVSIAMAQGTTSTGDVLVGADGIGSVVRGLLHPDELPPRSSELVAVRGAVHGQVAHLDGRDAILYLGRGVEATVVRASDVGIYWYLSLAAQLVPPDIRDPHAIVALMAPQLDPLFRRIAESTTDLRTDMLADRDPLGRWGSGRVTLLGDAAHPVLPHTGQGAAQAMVDAVTLGRYLGDVGDVARALRGYEAERQPETAALVGQGRRTARMMRTMHPLMCAVRDAMLRVMPVATFLRLYVHISRQAGDGDERLAAGDN